MFAFAFPNYLIGYSDHTLPDTNLTSIQLAHKFGARIVEKHFTLDRDLPGPDHKASLEPEELKAMVNGIRNIEKSLGNGVKVPSASEQKNISVARRSIVAREYIKKGKVFTNENLTAKRPGIGISPMDWDKVIGKRSERDYPPDTLIE